MSQPWRGIFPIVVTPFTEAGAVDETSLQRVVRFCIEAGARGLVGPANASEFTTLSDAERRRWLEVVVETAAGEIPVVASVTSGHAFPAAALAQHAQEVGADGVMAMPPPILHPDADGCFRYYQALDERLSLPICVQNFSAPVGTPMAPALLARLCNTLERVEYIKEETIPEPQRLSETIAAAGAACRGVMGGQGGIYLLNEYPRGAVGNMPSCHTVDIFARIWDRLEAGASDEARALFNRLLPLINHERLYGVEIYKLVLVRRGIIASPAMRAPAPGLDRYDREELEHILAGVESLYVI